MQRSLNKKVVALVLALVLILGASIGGTLAYLITKTATVTNTFTVGDIGTLKLEETKTPKTGAATTLTATEDLTTNQVNDTFVIVPGVDLAKDPKVTYTGDSNDVDVVVPETNDIEGEQEAPAEDNAEGSSAEEAPAEDAAEQP